MARKVYQTKITASWLDEDEKHPATHMLVPMKEYEKMCDDIRKANSETYQAKLEAKQIIEDLEKKNKKEREELRKSYEADHDHLWGLLEAKNAEIKRLAGLNEDLLRVARERANAERKMNPKKERSGYRLLKSGATRKNIGYNKNTGAVYKDVWETVLECPYEADIPLEQIAREIYKDLKEKVLPGMGAKGYGIKGDEGNLWKGSYEDALEVGGSTPVVFDFAFSINTKGKPPYRWVITLITTMPVTVSKDLMG